MLRHFLFICMAFALLMPSYAIDIDNLRCEYQKKPLNIDTQSPRFTWEFQGDDTDFEQTHYRLCIATSADLLKKNQPDVWDSGKTESNLPYAIYNGTGKLSSHTCYYWKVETWNDQEMSFQSDIETFETAKMNSNEWQAKWISDDKDKEVEAAPLFRKTFTIKENIENARAYISAAGYYELFINGKRVGKNFLDPGYTHYDKRSLYAVHDITPYLKKGENVVAAVLGNGFYNCQSRAVWDFEKARWRNRPRMICELRIYDKQHNATVIGSNNSWLTSTGAFTYNNIYSGDKYDARLEEEGWNDRKFNDSEWTAAKEVKAPSPLLVAQTAPAIQITEEIQPVCVNMLNDTTYVFDFGKNIAGVCHLKAKGEKNTTFCIRHGELLKKDGSLEQGNINIYYRPVKPGEIFQTDWFTLKGTGKTEEFIPQFTYHGFRYVEITSNRPVKLNKKSLTALVLRSAVQKTGTFRCSLPVLNHIWDATMLSYEGNIHSIPTDCPQREKNGWTADAHTAIDLALQNYDGIGFYEKWMNDFIDNQRTDGSIAGIIPTDTWGYGSFPGPVWDAALFIIPNAIYNYYGDTRCIEKLLPTMQRYLSYITKQEKQGVLNFGLGDWLTYKAQTPNDYTSTLYYYLDYKLMARFCNLLGKDTKFYEDKAEQIKETINTRFFNPETGIYGNGSQTSLAVALYWGIVPREKELLVARNLYQRVKSDNYFLDFGLLGSKTVLHVLSRYGYIDAAFRMATQTEAPSWGYWTEKQGFTTLAETWLLSPEFRDASVNHVFMGEIAAWMKQTITGINYDEEEPGFEHIIIRPQYPEGLNWAEGCSHTVKGKINVKWERTENGIVLSVDIPQNCRATIFADKIHQEKGGHYEYQISPALN